MGHDPSLVFPSRPDGNELFSYSRPQIIWWGPYSSRPEEVIACPYGIAGGYAVLVFTVALLNCHRHGDSCRQIILQEPCVDFLFYEGVLLAVEVQSSDDVLQVSECGFNAPAKPVEFLDVFKAEMWSLCIRTLSS